MEQSLKRAPYTRTSPETWELIRSDYLRGASAGALARRFGVTVDAIYKRASLHGWTKLAWASRREAGPFPKDPMPAPPAPSPEPAGDPPSAEPEDIIDAALAEAARALAGRKPEEAQAYLRVADLARRLMPKADARASAPEPERKDYSEELRAELTRRLDRLRDQMKRKKAEAGA